jgi:hypothetical protein
MRNAIAGREGQRPAFPREHAMLLQRFEDAELIDLADYLSRLGPAPDLGAVPPGVVSGTHRQGD